MRFRIIKKATSCGLCFGMGTREMPNGDTIPCLNCNGKGIL